MADTLYGSSSPLINRHALHAYKVIFIHPLSGEKVEMTAELPDDIKKLLNP